jgi:hypothetical protein
MRPYPHTTSATGVREGAAPAPADPGAPPASPGTVPAHCEVRGVIRPSRDSNIKFALWLPAASAWNAKYRQEGNGGWAGAINTAAFAEPLRRGYAVAGTDDGHEGGGGADWAIGHPEKLIDFGYRAVHETAVQSKAIVRAFYGRDPERSYFNGCSDGGREALMEAQRLPDYFNGILAGAPANNWSRLFTAFVWNERALLATPEMRANLDRITAFLCASEVREGFKASTDVRNADLARELRRLYLVYVAERRYLLPITNGDFRDWDGSKITTFRPLAHRAVPRYYSGHALPHLQQVQPGDGRRGRSPVAARQARRLPAAIGIRRGRGRAVLKQK